MKLIRMGVKGALVIAEGEHLCMKMRGVRNDDPHYNYSTSRSSRAERSPRTGAGAHL